MGLFDSIGGGVGGILGGLTGFNDSFNPSYNQLSTLTPEQQQALSALIPQLMSAYQGGGTSFIGGEQAQGALNSLMSGQPAYEINPETTEQYYRESIEAPALRQYQEQVRPAFLESTSNIHSSARDRLESEGLSDLYSNLSQQRSNLYYQDEQARRQALQQAQQTQLAGLQTNLGYQQGMLQESQLPLQNLLTALGVSGVENIVNQPSAIQGLLGHLSS